MMYTGQLQSQPNNDHAIGSQRAPMRLPMGLGDDAHLYPCRISHTGSVSDADSEQELNKRKRIQRQRENRIAEREARLLGKPVDLVKEEARRKQRNDAQNRRRARDGRA